MSHAPGAAYTASMRALLLPFLLSLAPSPGSQEPLRVLSLSPPSGSLSVDPSVRDLQIAFDRSMDTGNHSVLGGGPSFPRVLETTWDDPRTFLLRVELAHDHVYSMEIASLGGRGFRSRQGHVLADTVPWRFATLPPKATTAEERRALGAQVLSALGRALQDRYSYRDRLGVDWQHRIDTYQERVLQAPGGAAVTLLLAELLEPSRDPHLTLRWRNATLPVHTRRAEPNFRAQVLPRHLKELRKINDLCLVGRTDDDIGYLLVASFANEQRALFDQAIEALRGLAGVKRLVIDVRPNGGGNELLARSLAAWFVQGSKVYAQHTVRDPQRADGFLPPAQRVVTGNPPPDRFDIPVAVLCGPVNMSSCEAFLLMMKQADKCILVGDVTYGSSGNPQPVDLATDLQVFLPSWRALRADGSCFEGEGITPDVLVRTTAADLAERDPVLHKALDTLRGR